MPIRVHNAKRLASGLLFLAIGLFGMVYGSRYRMGTASHPGPGYFPFVVSAVVAALGLASALIETRKRRDTDDKPIAWHVVPLVCILAGIVAFGLLVERAGLVLAVAAVVILGCYQRLLTRPGEVLAIGLVLIVLSVVLFIRGLGMPWHALPI